ncbi:MAG: DNA double-strand break repair nuclease NurA [Desulfurococcaceae archaeon]|nr:DNA double-strand break repair nuclease NurA [Desulfurococcaceae archaeon]
MIEKDILKILNLAKAKFDKEKDLVIKMLQKYRWIPLDKDMECSCAAVDSSFLVVESRLGFIYVIQGISILYNIENNVLKKIDFKPFSDAGFIEIQMSKGSYIVKKSIYKKVLTEYAYTLELSSIVELVKKHSPDIVLLDGSFISFAMSRKTKNSKAYVESVKGRFNLEEIEDLKIDNVKNLANHRYTVFLAKSSSAGFYTQGLFPDMYILELARLYKIEPYSKPGFLEPLTIDVKNSLSKYIKELSETINDITVTYIRLKHGIPVYQLSFPYRVGEEDLSYVYMCLKKYSPAGYPAPLEYVHRFSKLPKRKLMNTMMMLGIPIASGKEPIDLP